MKRKLTIIVPAWIERANHLTTMFTDLDPEVSIIFVVSGSASDSYIRTDSTHRHIFTEERLGILEAMRIGASHADKDSDLIFMHDDVTILEPNWPTALAEILTMDGVGIVGLGGSPQLGTDDLYKTWYDLNQLARVGGFYSNMVNWRDHGFRAAAEVTRAAAVDGFFMAFTRECYDAIGGWGAAEEDGLPQMHMYDAWACAAAAENGYGVVVYPALCTHAGGKTSTTPEYAEFVKGLGYASGQELFEEAHRVIYQRFENVLPVRVR